MLPGVLFFVFLVAEILAGLAHALSHILTLLNWAGSLRTWWKKRRRRRNRPNLD